jgi:hypothetical protein
MQREYAMINQKLAINTSTLVEGRFAAGIEKAPQDYR